MYIVRKKYMIKAIALFITFVGIITGIFVSDIEATKKQILKEESNEKAEMINLLSDFQVLCDTFEKSIDLNTPTSLGKEIYARCMLIRSHLFDMNIKTENTVGWLNELSDYTNTEMNDEEKNKEYLTKLRNATAILINNCENPSSIDLTRLEELFAPKTDSEEYKEMLNELENEYPLLNNRIKASVKEITEYAMSVLNHPILPRRFKGNYTFPGALSYTTQNSYAAIHPSGNTLNRMATEPSTNTPAYSYTVLDKKAEEYLKQYAPYAQNCKRVYKEKIENTVYYIFCPEYYTDTVTIFNYDEQIRIALNAFDGRMKAFDATKYLKNPGKDQITTEWAKKQAPDFGNNTLISENTVIIDRLQYTEYIILSTSGQKYYVLSQNSNDDIILTQKEFLKILNR